MRHFILTLMLASTITSCASQPDGGAAGIYEEVGGSQMLVVGERLAYLGPKDVPNESRLLEEHGSPIKTFSIAQGVCVEMAGLTFVKSEHSEIRCNGLDFRSVQKHNDGVREYVATCYALTRTGCSNKNGTGPELQYQYTIRDGKGLEEIIFLGGGSPPKSVLKFNRGRRLFAEN